MKEINEYKETLEVDEPIRESAEILIQPNEDFSLDKADNVFKKLCESDFEEDYDYDDYEENEDPDKPAGYDRVVYNEDSTPFYGYDDEDGYTYWYDERGSAEGRSVTPGEDEEDDPDFDEWE